MNKLNKIAYGHILKQLTLGPSNPHEIAEASGMHIRTIQVLMNVWKRMKVVHIKNWDPDSMGRDQIPVFALGEGRNARRRAMTKAERSQRARDKKKQMEMNHALHPSSAGADVSPVRE